MPSYYVNKYAQADGYHEVHAAGCSHMPRPSNLISLGQHVFCKTAVLEAKEQFSKVDGCAHCCPTCSEP